MEAAGRAEPGTTLYFDDSTRNIAAGAELGLFSVLVGRQGANVGADVEVRPLIHAVMIVMQGTLWYKVCSGVYAWV